MIPILQKCLEAAGDEEGELVCTVGEEGFVICVSDLLLSALLMVLHVLLPLLILLLYCCCVGGVLGSMLLFLLHFLR